MWIRFEHSALSFLCLVVAIFGEALLMFGDLVEICKAFGIQRVQ